MVELSKGADLELRGLRGVPGKVAKGMLYMSSSALHLSALECLGVSRCFKSSSMEFNC